MKSLLVHIAGFRATLVHGDTLVLDRWLWLQRRLKPLLTLNEDSRLLDVGCGTGAFTIGAAKLGYRCLGLSWDTRNQQVARERALICHVPSARFEVQDVRNLDRRADLAGQFDVVVCCECIEHIRNDRKLMTDLARCLRPGGRLLLTTPSFHFIPMDATDRLTPLSTIEDGGHVRRGYTAEDLRALCAPAGLEIQAIGYCSGWVSQKLTGLERFIARHTHHLVGWGLILPLRWAPPLLDPIVRRFTQWPGYSITLEADKPADRASA